MLPANLIGGSSFDPSEKEGIGKILMWEDRYIGKEEMTEAQIVELLQ